MTDLTNTTVPRRSFLRTVATLGAAVAAVGVPSALTAESTGRSTHTPFARPNSPDEALQRLLDGNARFVAGKPQAPHRDFARLREVEPKQAPFAAFLGCADSRVPIEIIFDQGFGDCFPVRVAGNIVSPEIIASLEFGCAVLGAQTLVVLGHSKCGAVKATLDGGAVPGQISTLYQHIQPAVDAAHGDLDAAIAINVRNQASLLRKSSPVLAGMIKSGTLRIVGAVYDLASGKVSLLDA
jgi:carbonic anhydrase